METHTLKIDTKGRNDGLKAKITLDGIPIPNIERIEVTLEAGYPNVAILRLTGVAIDVDGTFITEGVDEHGAAGKTIEVHRFDGQTETIEVKQ